MSEVAPRAPRVWVMPTTPAAACAGFVPAQAPRCEYSTAWLELFSVWGYYKKKKTPCRDAVWCRGHVHVMRVARPGAAQLSSPAAPLALEGFRGLFANAGAGLLPDACVSNISFVACLSLSERTVSLEQSSTFT